MCGQVKNELDRCLQRLVAQGKRFGGCLSYQIIDGILRHNRCEISMDTLDLIYQRLQAEKIEIVDELPEQAAINHTNLQDNGKGFRKPRSRTRVIQQKRFKYISNDKLSTIKQIPCPEEAIDKLLYRWEITKNLSGRYFFAIIEKYYLTRLEIMQLIDYLGSKGIEIDNSDHKFSKDLWQHPREA